MASVPLLVTVPPPSSVWPPPLELAREATNWTPFFRSTVAPVFCVSEAKVSVLPPPAARLMTLEPAEIVNVPVEVCVEPAALGTTHKVPPASCNGLFARRAAVFVTELSNFSVAFW